MTPQAEGTHQSDARRTGPEAAAMEPPIPPEFTKQYIKDNTSKGELYTKLLNSGEPYRSLHRKNKHIGAREGFMHFPYKDLGVTLKDGINPETKLNLDDETVYYNTSGEAAAYWKDTKLPKPTKDIKQLRADLKQWGYCIIHEALSARQLECMQRRTEEQAEGERLAGVATWASERNQFIHAIFNKDAYPPWCPQGIFAACMVNDPAGCQAGPVIEQLIEESIGKGYIGSSFLGIIAHKHGHPQPLHQDQGVMHMGGVQEAPWSLNTMYVLDDFTDQNGGTLVVPGSHTLISSVGAGKPVPTPFPPAINLQAPAGSVVMFEGRLLHGTGVNRTDRPRRMFVANSLKPQFRQQEMWLLSLDPEVLAKASPKFLYRMGFRPTGLGGIEGDWNPNHEGLRTWRQAMDRGEFKPIRQLSPNSTMEELTRDYTWRKTANGQFHGKSQPTALPAVKELYGVDRKANDASRAKL